jgi:hypothetical protein
MKEILTNPVAAIMHAKKRKDMSETIQLLIVDWIIISVAFLLIPNLGLAAKAAAAAFVGVVGILGTLFFGFLIQLVFNVLGGKGRFYEGLTSAVYAKFPIAVGIFIAALFTWLPFAGLPIAVLASIIFTIIGVVAFYRSVKELFGTDIITAWIGVSILVLGIILGLYIAAVPLVGSGFPQQLGMGPMMSS